jgi:hypothetical protein
MLEQTVANLERQSQRFIENQEEINGINIKSLNTNLSQQIFFIPIDKLSILCYRTG